jgi:hypothetical protein
VRVAGLAVVGTNAKSHDVCYLVAIGEKTEVAYNLPAVLLRKESICDNQSHYAREKRSHTIAKGESADQILASVKRFCHKAQQTLCGEL